MILRIDRLQTELPPPSTPDPAGAAAVQELMGGKFGEMSTLMNYTFQSFNFRDRQGARPFYDLIANIAAEEYGHIELVAADDQHDAHRRVDDRRRQAPRRRREGVNPQHFMAGGKGALPADSHGKPWNGDYVHLLRRPRRGPDAQLLPRDRRAQQQAARSTRCVDHPAARALTGYLLVRGGVHQVAYARALENLTGADMTKLFPTPRIPTDKIPECQPHIERGRAPEALPLLARRLPRDRRGLQRQAPRDGRGRSRSSTRRPRASRRNDLPPQPDVFAPDYAPEEIAEIAQKLREAAGLPDEPPGVVASSNGSARKRKAPASKPVAKAGRT